MIESIKFQSFSKFNKLCFLCHTIYLFYINKIFFVTGVFSLILVFTINFNKLDIPVIFDKKVLNAQNVANFSICLNSNFVYRRIWN